VPETLHKLFVTKAFGPKVLKSEMSTRLP